MKKFPSQSSLLSDLCILNPAERLGYQNLPTAVIPLAKRFPQLQLGEKFDQLKTEAFDLQMAGDGDLPDTNDVWMTFGQVEAQGLPSQPILPCWCLFVPFLPSLLAMLTVSAAFPWFPKSSLKITVTLSVAQLLPF